MIASLIQLLKSDLNHEASSSAHGMPGKHHHQLIPDGEYYAGQSSSGGVI